MARDDVHELTAAYALHALDSTDEAAFEEHLRACAPCRAELAGLQETAASLAVLHEGPAPPRELRARILERAREERAVVVPLRRRRAFQVSLAAAAAATAAAIGLGAWAASLSSRLDEAQTARSAQEQALAIVADPAADRFPLADASGALVVGSDGEAALVANLPAPPAGKVYEAWVSEDGETMVPAGTFGAEGGRIVFRLARPVPPGGLVAVTVENEGGVPAPTGAPILSAQTS